ncbi:MAG TPA: NAD-glutamate dehydrogenase, partial [Brevundimonas sp.]|nr:NAD-glutamate dehydrogenase [Brevundimonas sp.]
EKQGKEEVLAPLNDTGLGLMRGKDKSAARPVKTLAAQGLNTTSGLKDALILTKTNARSRVHRAGYMDYIGVLEFDAKGKIIGEQRFLGLFTSSAYNRRPWEIPLVRQRHEHVMKQSGLAPASHSGKALRHILETLPREELFQSSEDELFRTAMGVLGLQERVRSRLFLRRDKYSRFISALVYLPRERFNTDVRLRIEAMLKEALHGEYVDSSVVQGESPLAQVHLIVRPKPGEMLDVDTAELEQKLAQVLRNWQDDLREALVTRHGETEGLRIAARIGKALPAGYIEDNSTAVAANDVSQLDALTGPDDLRLSLQAVPRESGDGLRLKLYRQLDDIPLSDALPMMENMGLRVIAERPYRLSVDNAPVYVQDFEVESTAGAIDAASVDEAFGETFARVWHGDAENDGFNRLVLELGVDWREAALIRTLARYRQQTGLDPSQSVQEAALREYPDAARAILALFKAKFDPAHGGSVAEREAAVAELDAKIETLLQDVKSLDHDRALRRISALIDGIKRTNFYQVDAEGNPKAHISIKIAAQELADLPLPKPFREIFVWAPYVEGTHLRFGPVARGGLRWSDRRDDFRTEVLGLVKAQQVKNSVIVPVGSKGGFYPKQLPVGGTREETQAEAIRAYKTFLSGMLDITDNIVGDGAPVRPANVVAWEGDDPYLVVAADKGTATFSDIANGVSQSYGFWLDDAFASGGSAGYDHKEMGITARGAWEAVKRHFREVGKDIQTEPFTVVGVGDMSGDVFGNGMLLSQATKVVAAFDHRDIFIDPNPDVAKSWAERKRLFETPRTSWQDYDKSLISEGGGVFSRSAKSIALTPQIKELLDIEADSVDPVTLMQAILKARAELLYFGGIGTYIKGSGETNLQVGDKANDAIRINGGEVRAQIIGEGANLGMTQLGRIEAARVGVRLNTDAIDNSAGVDSSDQEVNIKILLGGAIASGHLKAEDRNALLKSMTDEVAHNVLRHNYDQTLALTLQQAEGANALDAQQAFMQHLVSIGKLNRAVEYLPDDARMAEMKLQGQALSRPELAVLTAYSKLELFDEIVASAAPDDAFFERMLVDYFPTPLAQFESDMKGHRLRRDIIATVLSNEIVNMAGPTFADRLRAAAECDTAAMVTAFETARHVFRLDEAWKAVSALDLKIPAEAQTALYQEIALVLRRQTFWLARRAARTETTVGGMIAAYQPAADALRAAGPEVLSRYEHARYEGRVQTFIGLGAPEELARDIAMLRPMVATADIGDLAGELGWDAPAMARVYHQVGAAFDFDRLRVAAGSVPSGDHFDRLAVRRLIQDLMTEQQQLTRAVAKASAEAAGAGEDSAEQAVDAWIGARMDQVEALRGSVDEIETSGSGWTFAKLTIANGAIREVLASAS